MTVIINEFEVVVEPQEEQPVESIEIEQPIDITPLDIKKILHFFLDRDERLRAD